jgi:adenylate cyclase class 1
LIASFRTIGQFIRQHQEYFEKYKPQLLLLSRKISARLEQTQGKIERVNINFVQQMLDKHLSLVRQFKGRDLELWSFYDRAISQQEAQSIEPVYQCNSLLELLVWAKVNGLLTEGTSVQYRDAKQQLQYDELEQLIQTLLANSYDRLEVSDEAFQSPAKVTEISCFINIAQDRLTDIAKQGVHIITRKNDPFCYGDECINLIETIDLYYVNTWGEQFVVHFQGENCLSEATIALLELIERQSAQPQIEYFSFSSMRSDSVVTRVKQFIRHTVQLYQSSQANVTKFFFRLGHWYHMIQKQDNRYLVHKANNEVQLARLLLSQPDQYQLIQFDARCFSDPVIAAATQKFTPGERLLVVNNAEGHFVSYCFVDSMGGLVYQTFRSAHAEYDLATLYACLKESLPSQAQAPLHCYVYNRDGSLSRLTLDTSLPESEVSLSVRYFSDQGTPKMRMEYLDKHFIFERDDPELSQRFLAWLDRAFDKDEQGFYIAELVMDPTDGPITEAGLLLERNELTKRLTATDELS